MIRLCDWCDCLSFQIFAGVSAFFAIVYCVSLFTSHKFSYKNKHVLITGGSSGIGLELAKQYIKLGAHVTIMARDMKRLLAAQDLLRCIKAEYQKVCVVSVDAAESEAAVAEALKSCITEIGDVDVLINNAGTSIAGEFDSLSTAEFERMFRVNVLSAVYATHAVLPAMKRKRSGRIVFVSSQVAQAAIHGYSAYGASKWALRGLAEALQMEVKPFDIYVSVSYPPDTDTPGYQVEMESKPRITRLLSESGAVFSAAQVANDIATGSACGQFAISTGLDGWMLRQLHPGMTPMNNLWEVAQQVAFSSIARLVALFYVTAWDRTVAVEVSRAPAEAATTQQSDPSGGRSNKKIR